ncbi:hypothetical protein C8R44DRAFT_85746 [Mycena epipterygia]|nr:hypothetical protein C8R44DRAFT_85746 [Mycena epipterygia]
MSSKKRGRAIFSTKQQRYYKRNMEACKAYSAAYHRSKRAAQPQIVPDKDMPIIHEKLSPLELEFRAWWGAWGGVVHWASLYDGLDITDRKMMNNTIWNHRGEGESLRWKLRDLQGSREGSDWMEHAIGKISLGIERLGDIWEASVTGHE